MKMSKRIEMIGKTFGQITVESYSHSRKKGGCMYVTVCSCGSRLVRSGVALRARETQRCVACANKLKTTHGKSKTSEFRVWLSMLGRCKNPNNKNWVLYGGRGILVCERWNSFEGFYEDMGSRPGPKYQLDRIDNNKGYSPENCRWVTPAENIRNSRRCSICNCECRIKKRSS